MNWAYKEVELVWIGLVWNVLWKWVSTIIIPYHFTIPPTSQNSIFIKILFFNLSLLFPSNSHFFSDFSDLAWFQQLHHHQSPHHHHHHHHHTSTSMAPPSSITTPPPPRLHHHQSPHHHHHTTTKMLQPLIIHITQSENPNLFQQACSHWWTQRNSWTQTPPINPNHNRKKKTKNKKQNQINPDQNPDTTATRSMFPPSLINLDQPPKSHWNKNPDIADQPRSQQEKKKKPDQPWSKPRHRYR